MQLKKLMASVLVGAFAVSICACDTNEEPTLPDPHQFYAVQDRVADLFNDAIGKLADSDSYVMRGSLASTAEVLSSGELTSVVTPIDCTYQSGRFLIDSSKAKIDPRTTYFDGERYYYTLLFNGEPINCFSNENDHVDYVAADYLMEVDSEILFNPHLTENEDGSTSLSFDIPFTVYESPAMIGHLGFIVDDSHQSNPLSVQAALDPNGYMTEFVISFVNDTDFGDDLIHQEIVANMELLDYNCAVLTPPENLESYADWTEDVPEMTTEGFGEHSPEDMQ